MNIPCDIIRDLIPLVKDNVASDVSTKIVNEHIEGCKNCRAEFEAFGMRPEQPSVKDEQIITAIRRSILITQLIILIAGTVIGIALSNSMGMFYNFIIMPVIGGISLIAFKARWYLTPLAIFVVTYLWLTVKNIALSGFTWLALYDGLYFATIYTVLVGLGAVIAMLLRFIFQRRVSDMKGRKKAGLKILAAIAAALLIGGILFITNAFVGNPLSAMRANKAIGQYVSQKYSHLNLEIGKVSYDFKNTAYISRAKSKTSIDTNFAVYYRDGRIERDDYESYVLGMFNTLDRLSHEYSLIAKNIAAEELGYENNTTMVMFDKGDYENANDIVELDMKFDRKLPLHAEVTIRLDLENHSLESIAEVLTKAHEAFKANDCNFDKYGLYTENDGVFVMVNGVTPAHIESGELLSLLEKAKGNEGMSEISVFIKGEK